MSRQTRDESKFQLSEQNSVLPDGWYALHPSTEHPKRRHQVDHLGLPKSTQATKIRIPHIQNNNDGKRSQHSSPRKRILHMPSIKSPSYPKAEVQHTTHMSGAKNTSIKFLSPPSRLASPLRHSPMPSPRVSRFVAHTESIVPLHEVAQTCEDTDYGTTEASSSTSCSITELMMEQWIQQHAQDRSLYKSAAVHAEIGFQELYRLMANVAFPNEVATSFACRVFDDMVPHFGPYTTIMRVLSSELRLAIYAMDQNPSLPFFSIVKKQKRILRQLRKEHQQRHERNDFLQYEIGQVHNIFLYFIDQCGRCLLRTILREWFSVAIIQKRNTKKYITYFSAWFSTSAKTLIPRLFIAWKHRTMDSKILKMKEQVTKDQERINGLQKQIDDLCVTRDLIQLENLAMRNDRKAAEDNIQRIQRKIQSANVYLEGSPKREALVALEGQLRMEAMMFLPPLVLESLLRRFYSVGFMQQANNEFVWIPPSTTIPMESNTNRVSLLQECLQVLIKPRVSQPPRFDVYTHKFIPVTTVGTNGLYEYSKLTLEDFISFLNRIQQHVSASSSNLLFFLRKNENEEIQESDPMVTLAQNYEQLISAIRIQDEHYARHVKLFSFRMLETHEVTVRPTSHYISEPSQRLVEESVVVQPIQPTRDHQVIHGRSRYSVANIETSCDSMATPDLPFFRSDPFELSSRHSQSCIVLFLAHLIQEYASLVFAPTDLSAFLHNSKLQEMMLRRNGLENDTSLKPRASQSKSRRRVTMSMDGNKHEEIDIDIEDDKEEEAETKRDEWIPLNPEKMVEMERGMEHLLAVYDGWNKLSIQLVNADIAQARGHTEGPTNSLEGSFILSNRSSSPMDLYALRPKLHLHIEPLLHGVLMTANREANSNSNKDSSFPIHRMTGSETANKLKRIDLADVAHVTQHMESLYQLIQSTETQAHEFTTARQQVRQIRAIQWTQACDLASQFTSQSPSESSLSSSDHHDDRKHIYECMTLENPVIERLFSVETSPMEELDKVYKLLERKKILLRHLYTPYRPGMTYALTLDDLWHFIKLCRLPRDVHVLPAIRDEEILHHDTTDQVISPTDLAEILLQLCNEQFPMQTNLSSRLEYFILHHLSLITKHQSLIREIMQQTDVKKALNDHATTLRVIFRRYCAKEKKKKGMTGPSHGITKYMRMSDWEAFIQDYNLIRPSFPRDYATIIFRNVQQAESGIEDDLEMIYSEFCEAIVGISAYFFPDPFLSSVTRIHQFIRRYLLISIESND